MTVEEEVRARRLFFCIIVNAFVRYIMQGIHKNPESGQFYWVCMYRMFRVLDILKAFDRVSWFNFQDEAIRNMWEYSLHDRILPNWQKTVCDHKW